MRIILPLTALLLAHLFPLPTHAGEVDEALTWLRSEYPEVRYNGAQQLRRLGKKAKPAIPALLKALGDNGIPSEFKLQYFGPRINDAASQALVSIGRPAVPALIDALDHKDKTIRVMAIRTLAELGSKAQDAFPTLRDLLEDPDEEIRWKAAKAIAQLGKEPEVVVPLLDRLIQKDKNHIVRETALEALYHADPTGKWALPILKKQVNYNGDGIWSGEIISAAVRTLGKFGPKAGPAVPRLIEALSTKKRRSAFYADFGYYVPVRRDVVRTLAEIGPPAAPAVPKLIKIMDREDDPGTSLWAAAAILRIQPDSSHAERAFNKLVEADALEALGTVETSPAVEVLIDVLKAKPPSEWNDRQYMAIEALGNIGPKAAPAVPLLIKAINSPKDDLDSYFVDYRAIEALGKIGPKAAPAAPLLKRFRDNPANDNYKWNDVEEWDLSQRAEKALRKIQNSEEPN